MRLKARVFGFAKDLGSTVRNKWFEDRVRPPLYEGSPLDDFLFGQPANIPLRVVRWALTRRSARSAGCTVVIVNYNTLAPLKDVLSAVRRNSSPDIEIVVVDNASSDGSWLWLQTSPMGVRAVRSPVNLGHGRALDIGMGLARTPLVVTLDPDALPVSPRWLDVLLEPLRDDRVKAAGSWGRRDRLHPAFAAYRRSEVIKTGLSFHNYKPHLDTGDSFVFGHNCWDTGEYLFERLGRDHVALLDVRGSDNGWGEVIADVVYHHRAVTAYDARNRVEQKSLVSDRLVAWNEAVRRYYPDGI